MNSSSVNSYSSESDKTDLLTPSNRLSMDCLNTLSSFKAHDLISIDVSSKSSIADFMIIGTGTSDRHVSAMADKLIEHLKKSGLQGITVSGQELGQWVIVDTGTVMVHLMQQEVRDRYQLEDLYRCMAAGIGEQKEEI